jgi:hypothetical protein
MSHKHLPVLVLASASALALAALPTKDTPTTPEPAVGGALAWADYDGDGVRDVYVANPAGEDRLFRGLANGRFEDVTEAVGLSGVMGTSAARWADTDGDGYPELFLAARGGSRLLKNDGAGLFLNVTERAGLPGSISATDGAWLDYDGDGAVDLAVATVGGEVLYHNTGAGLFEEVALGVPRTLLADAAPNSAAGYGAPDADVRPTPTVSGGPGGPGTIPPVDRGGSGTNAPAPPPGGSTAPLPPPVPAPAGHWCPAGVDDLSNPGACLPASTVPTLGAMIPLGDEFFVAADGDVGFGTTTPFGRFQIKDDGVTGGPFLSLEATGNMVSNYDMIELKMPSTSTAQFIECETESGMMMQLDLDGTLMAHRFQVADYLRIYDGSFDAAKAGSYNSIRGSSGNLVMNAAAASGDIYLNYDNGDDVYIGLPGTEATTQLDIRGRVDALSDTTGTTSATVRAENTNTATGGIAYYGRTYGDDATAVFSQQGDGDIIKGFSVNANGGGSAIFRVTNTGRAVASALEITGGGDIVEGFEAREGVVEAGTVMSIDPQTPGQLTISSSAYDAKVAGVVSGAGGVNHGLRLGQDGVLDGETLVAMTGRVYVKCSSENGAISPGDLLTTADLDGHAMRATDGMRSFGTVIGKAMGSLDQGTGLVLVLVNLQ